MQWFMVALVWLLPIGLAQADGGMAGNGLISKKSAHGVTETLNRLEAALKKKGITILLRLPHDASAKKVGVRLRPTGLLIFGNPQLGSQMFTSVQTAGIDLPMKALVWEDETGQVWLTYNDPAYIAKRHGITDRDEIVIKMGGVLDKLSDEAVGP